MAEIVLVRHAQVSIDPVTLSRQWSLSSNGRSAAEQLLRDPAVADGRTFFSSPEEKAVLTARTVAHGQFVHIVSDLRELDRTSLGWVGSQSEYESVIEQILRTPDQSVRGCEPAGVAMDRVVKAIEGISVRCAEGAVVVSHGIVLALLMGHVGGLAHADLTTWRRIGLPDVAVVDSDNWRVIRAFSGGTHRE